MLLPEALHRLPHLRFAVKNRVTWGKIRTAVEPGGGICQIRILELTFLLLEILAHHNNSIAEVISDEILVLTAEDGTDLLMNLYYQGFDKMIWHERNINPAFFELNNGMAGEVLQKFSNYRVSLCIVGDFSKYAGNSIRSFMAESNRTGSILFLPSTEEAVARLTH